MTLDKLLLRLNAFFLKREAMAEQEKQYTQFDRYKTYVKINLDSICQHTSGTSQMTFGAKII